MERAMGIEPTSEAWEARNKNLKRLELAAVSIYEPGLNWGIMENGKLRELPPAESTTPFDSASVS
jgi:hypothetical protein